MQRSLVTVGLAEALLASLTAAHRQGSPHVDTPGLCTALAIALGVQNVGASAAHGGSDAELAAITTTAVAFQVIKRAADKTLADLDNGVADDHGLLTRDLMASHAADTIADGLFTG